MNEAGERAATAIAGRATAGVRDAACARDAMERTAAREEWAEDNMMATEKRGNRVSGCLAWRYKD